MDEKYSVSLGLSTFESKMMYTLVEFLLNINNSFEDNVHEGNAPGISAFVFMGLTVDCSVHVYETLKLYEEVCGNLPADITDSQYWEDLKIVRNNVHTFSKNGSYYKKAHSIINEMIKKYKMNVPDKYYFLRNDISLVYMLKNNKKFLLGCDYFISHCIFESDNKIWSGERYKGFSEYISSMIYGFAQETTDNNCYEGKFLIRNKNRSPIELFDYKSPDLFSRLPLEKATTFRLMLLLYQISFGLYLITEIIDFEETFKSEVWMFFLTKIMAIKYDEAYDNICSLLQHSSNKMYLFEILKKNGINIDDLKAREFARLLRNTIHYGNIEYNSSKSCGNTSEDWIKTVYLSNCGIGNIQEFRTNSKILFKESLMLQNAIQSILDIQ